MLMWGWESKVWGFIEVENDLFLVMNIESCVCEEGIVDYEGPWTHYSLYISEADGLSSGETISIFCKI